MRRGPAPLLLVVLLAALTLPLWTILSPPADSPSLLPDPVGDAEAEREHVASLPGSPALRGAPRSPLPSDRLDEPGVVRWPGSNSGAGCNLEVHVLRHDGAAAGETLVRLLGEGLAAQGRETLLQGETDVDGLIRFEGLPRQTVLCEAELPDSFVRGEAQLIEGSSVVVTLQIGPGVTYVEGRVLRAGVRVAGRTVVARGRDAQGVSVWEHAKTNEGGRYHLALRPGSYELLVEGGPSDARAANARGTWWQPGGRGPWLKGGSLDTTGEPPLVVRDLVIHPTTIELEVHGDEGGPLAGARAFVLTSDLSDGGIASLTPDADGRITFVDLPFGKAEISVVADGAARWSRHVVLSAAHPEHRERVDLEAGATVRAVFKGVLGDVIRLKPGDPVFLEHLKTGARVERTVAQPVRSEEAALFEHVPLGRVRVFVDQPQTARGVQHGRLSAPDSVIADVGPGQVDVIVEGVHVLARIAIKVTPPAGRHDEWAHVGVEREDGRPLAPNDLKAPHWLGYLPPGSYRLTLNDGWTRTWEETIEVETRNAIYRFEAPR